MLEYAMEIAKNSVGTMTGPDGKSYLEHALRVMAQMDTDEEKAALARRTAHFFGPR